MPHMKYNPATGHILHQSGSGDKHIVTSCASTTCDITGVPETLTLTVSGFSDAGCGLALNGVKTLTYDGVLSWIDEAEANPCLQWGITCTGGVWAGSVTDPCHACDAGAGAFFVLPFVLAAASPIGSYSPIETCAPEALPRSDCHAEHALATFVIS